MKNAIDHNILQGKVLVTVYGSWYILPDKLWVTVIWKKVICSVLTCILLSSLPHVLIMNSRSSRCNLISPLKLFFYIFAVHLSSSRKKWACTLISPTLLNLPGFVVLNYTIRTCQQKRGLRAKLPTWEICSSIKNAYMQSYDNTMKFIDPTCQSLRNFVPTRVEFY